MTVGQQQDIGGRVMAFVADDIAEAALGPWGLLIGVGVGAALLARKRLVPAAGTAAAGGMEAGEKARDWAAGLPLVERAQTMLAEAGDWWSDLYAEAKSEWEANRHG